MKTLKITALATLTLPVLFASCGNRHTISANFKGLGDDTVYIERLPLNLDVEPVRDTVFSKNGRFTYDLPDTAATMLFVRFAQDTKKRIKNGVIEYYNRSNVITLIVSPGERLSIAGDTENPIYTGCSVKEPGFNHDEAALRESYKATEVKLGEIQEQMNYFMYSEEAPAYQDSLINALSMQQGELYDEINQIRLAWLKEHSDTDLAAYILLQQALPDFGEYYPLLGEHAKTGLFAQRIGEMEARAEAYKKVVEAEKFVVEGADAPQFTLKDLEGKDVSLADFKGKYVVLDFWGSWCGWCIHGVPEMKKYYDKYKSKVEFVGIACNDSDAAWRKAVEENKMNWVQLINQEGNVDTNASVKYAVKGYPTKVIVDKDQKIASIFVGESEDFYKKLDELLK